MFIISSFFYKRNVSSTDLLLVAIHYLIICTVVFAVTAMIKVRRFRYIVAFGIFIAPMTYLILIPDYEGYEFTPIYLLVTSFPINMSILPNNPYSYFEKLAQYNIYYYVVCFALPIAYWYGLYLIAKKIVQRPKKISELNLK